MSTPTAEQVAWLEALRAMGDGGQGLAALRGGTRADAGAGDLPVMNRDQAAPAAVGVQPKSTNPTQGQAKRTPASAAKVGQRTDKQFARKQAREDAARLRKAGTLTAEDRQWVNSRLDFFQGKAWEVYEKEIKPALAEVTQLDEQRRQEAEIAKRKEAYAEAEKRRQEQKRIEEGTAAYHQQTRQSQLELLAKRRAEKAREAPKMAPKEIDSQWGDWKEAFVEAVSSPGHGLKGRQLLMVWRRYWADRVNAADKMVDQIARGESAYARGGPEHEQYEAELEFSRWLLSHVVKAQEIIASAEARGKELTLDELNKLVIEGGKFHDAMVDASGMVVPGGLRPRGPKPSVAPKPPNPIRPVPKSPSTTTHPTPTKGSPSPKTPPPVPVPTKPDPSSPPPAKPGGTGGSPSKTPPPSTAPSPKSGTPAVVGAPQKPPSGGSTGLPPKLGKIKQAKQNQHSSIFTPENFGPRQKARDANKNRKPGKPEKPLPANQRFEKLMKFFEGRTPGASILNKKYSSPAMQKVVAQKTQAELDAGNYKKPDDPDNRGGTTVILEMGEPTGWVLNKNLELTEVTMLDVRIAQKGDWHFFPTDGGKSGGAAGGGAGGAKGGDAKAASPPASPPTSPPKSGGGAGGSPGNKTIVAHPPPMPKRPAGTKPDLIKMSGGGPPAPAANPPVGGGKPSSGGGSSSRTPPPKGGKPPLPDTIDGSSPKVDPADAPWQPGATMRPKPFPVQPRIPDEQRIRIKTPKGTDELTVGEYRRRWDAARQWLGEQNSTLDQRKGKGPTPELIKEAQKKFGLNDGWLSVGNPYIYGPKT